MSRKKSNCKYLWVVVIMVVAAGLSSFMSVGQDQVDSASERLKAISVSMAPNDLDEIRRLIEVGADVNVALEDGITALHIASFQGPERIRIRS